MRCLSRIWASRLPLVGEAWNFPTCVRNGSNGIDNERCKLKNIDADDDNTDRHSFTHLDSSGRAKMVDVSTKSVTTRTATACARVVMPSFVVEEVRRQNVKKGDVLTVAQIAGICGAKKTPDLIPLCHNIPLSKVDVELTVRGGRGGAAAGEAAAREPATGMYEEENTNASIPYEGIDVVATVKTEAKTGVEMEALTAVLVASLTVYDMCKALTKDIIIIDAYLIEKTGGKELYRRS